MPAVSNSALQLLGVVGTAVSHLPLYDSVYILSGVQGYKQILKPSCPAYLKLFKSSPG